MTDRPPTRSGRRASQMTYELHGLISVLRDNAVARYLEIGARHGDTFFDVMRSLPRGSYGHAVDLPGGAWGKDGTQTALMAAVDELRAMGYTIDVTLGDSTDRSIIDRIESLGPYDAALIDGDHRYPGVSKDWHNYRHMAGIVAFHDIVGVGERHCKGVEVEVPRLWDEIKESGADVLEYVAPGSKMGIGIVL